MFSAFLTPGAGSLAVLEQVPCQSSEGLGGPAWSGEEWSTVVCGGGKEQGRPRQPGLSADARGKVSCFRSGVAFMKAQEEGRNMEANPYTLGNIEMTSHITALRMKLC